MRYFLLAYVLIAAAVVSWAGFRGSPSEKPPIELFPDMDRQAKVKAQTPSDFFADGVSARKPVDGTMPIGFSPLEEPMTVDSVDWEGFGGGQSYAETGKIGDYFGDGFPKGLAVDLKLLERGRQRFQINCAVCHGASGNGKGITSQYGLSNTANLVDPLFGKSDSATYRPDGSLYDTIVHGRGLMGPYGANLNLHDRWAIVAYVRALQAAVPAAPSNP